MQVHGGGRRCEIRILLGDGPGDGCVFPSRGAQPLRIVLGQPADPMQVDAQVAQRGRQVGVAGGLVDRLIEPRDQLVVAAGGIRHGLLGGGAVEGLGQFGEFTGVGRAGGKPGVFAFKHAAQDEQVLQMVLADLGDDDAAPALGDCQPVGHQPSQGFAHRGARDA